MVKCPLMDEPGVSKQCTPLCPYHPEFFENFQIEEIKIEKVQTSGGKAKC